MAKPVLGRPRTASDEEILGAAMRAVGRYGPTRLTLAHVAEEAGLAPATLMQRFGSKQGLLRALADTGGAGVDEAFAAAEARHPSPAAALVAALASMGEGIETPTEMAHHVGLLHFELADPELREGPVRHTRLIRRGIRRLLDAALEAGELEAGDFKAGDTARLAEDVYGVYSGALVTWAIDGRGRLTTWIRRSVERALAPYRT